MSFSLRFSSFFIATLHALPAVAQISNVNGQPQFSGTPVQQNPVGIPTLVYNCAKVPSLCKNVGGNGGNYALTDLGSNLDGKLVNGNYLTLHIDPDSSRGNIRRGESCPTSRWKQGHPCPEPNQPLVVPEPYNKGGRTVSTGFVGYAKDTATFDYHILDPNGDFSGMAWTCDEFPPAFSVEGGQTGGSSANTYCAPQFSKDCTGEYTRSEQDFQSDAHGRIQSKEVAAGGQTQTIYQSNIWEIHFKTVFQDDDDAYATSVEWYIDPNGMTGSLYGVEETEQKRAEHKILVSHRVHGNGSIVELRRYVDMDHGMPNGTHPVGNPFDFDNLSDVTEYMVRPMALQGVKVATRYLAEPTPASSFQRERRDACTLPDPPQITDQPDEAAGTPAQSTFATYSCDVASVATSVGYN